MNEFYIKKNLAFTNISEKFLADWLADFNDFKQKNWDDYRSKEIENKADFSKVLGAVVSIFDNCKDFECLKSTKFRDCFKIISDNHGSYTFEINTKFNKNNKSHLIQCKAVARELTRYLNGLYEEI